MAQHPALQDNSYFFVLLKYFSVKLPLGTAGPHGSCRARTIAIQPESRAKSFFNSTCA